MIITICGSIEYTYEIKEIAERLIEQGHSVNLPFYSQKILDGEVSLEEYSKVKQERGDIEFRRKAEEDLIKRYFGIIRDSDAVLILNLDKKGISNYIGGNTFLEMGFAHVLGKKIFLMNPIPQMAYTDEVLEMNPTILNGNLERIGVKT
jgi:nucleoside 2-deoxyribosyltransferase